MSATDQHSKLIFSIAPEFLPGDTVWCAQPGKRTPELQTVSRVFCEILTDKETGGLSIKEAYQCVETRTHRYHLNLTVFKRYFDCLRAIRAQEAVKGEKVWRKRNAKV